MRKIEPCEIELERETRVRKIISFTQEDLDRLNKLLAKKGFDPASFDEVKTAWEASNIEPIKRNLDWRMQEIHNLLFSLIVTDYYDKKQDEYVFSGKVLLKNW